MAFFIYFFSRLDVLLYDLSTFLMCFLGYSIGLGIGFTGCLWMNGGGGEGCVSWWGFVGGNGLFEPSHIVRTSLYSCST